MTTKNIRNFCIIAHIDHGKSTLADRMLEITGTVDPRNMTAQFLDQMDLEKERGITIKGKAVRMTFQQDNEIYQLNLIDTPGHVDFGYEVSRALAACEGAILVVDASQGIQAQTLANAYLAIGHDLTILPVLNKIDLPFADPERIGNEMVRLFGFDKNEIVLTSAKEGIGISDVLSSIVKSIPPPKGDQDGPLKALIFDSSYDPYKGVIAYVRIFQGSIHAGSKIKMMGSKSEVEAIEVGVFRPNLENTGMLSDGEVGYIATGLKTVRDCRVGDTITTSINGASEELPGYSPRKLVVFAGLYPSEGESYQSLREALEKLQLNDPALSFEPENSQALGFGFRCGFLGPLHMEIVQERLEREYNLELIATSPSVAYKAITQKGEELTIANPSEMPLPHQLKNILEPWVVTTVVTPSRYIGPIMELMTSRRGNYKRIEYLSQENTTGDSSDPAFDARVVLEFELPLAELIIDFYDQIKSKSQGYASLDYEMSDYKEGALVKLDVMLNSKIVDALSFIVHKDKSYDLGKKLVNKLKDVIPRQMFEVAIQAALGTRIIARETIRPLRKNVLAKCYGGDISRKRKLLEKQAEGKKRLKRIGQVDVPQDAFLALLNSQK